MAPLVTQTKPQPSPIPPMPSATPDPGPKETHHALTPTPTSARSLKAPRSQQVTGFGSKSSSGEYGGIGQDDSPIAPVHQNGNDEDPEQKSDPNINRINNANEKTRQKSYPEQPPQGNHDTDSGQRAPLNSDRSRGRHDSPGQMGQQADSSSSVDQQQSNDGLENNPVSWEAPEGTPDQQVVTTIAGQTITANPTAVKVGSSTLTPGSPGLTLSGTLIS